MWLGLKYENETSTASQTKLTNWTTKTWALIQIHPHRHGCYQIAFYIVNYNLYWIYCTHLFISNCHFVRFKYSKDPSSIFNWVRKGWDSNEILDNFQSTRNVLLVCWNIRETKLNTYEMWVIFMCSLEGCDCCNQIHVRLLLVTV